MVKLAWSWPLTTRERPRPDRRAVGVEGDRAGRDRVDRGRRQGDGDVGGEGHRLAGDRGRGRGGEGRRRNGRLDGERQVGGIQRGVEEQAVAEDDPVVEAEVPRGRGEGQGLERVAQSGLEAVDEGDIERAAERRGARDGELVVLAAGRHAADVDVEGARGGLGVGAVDGESASDASAAGDDLAAAGDIGVDRAGAGQGAAIDAE